ncbi:hypothetical protein QQY66_05320 [Streptomyces sp. DG2A-72]|uniref:NAD(P)/FAD-dependent oxidoreductase n=1 Tax=Streptomyces sp. DG2A-72 TaxID=3051386 RepID=UPI00265C5BA4|nr:hypothetical protein [Streptomyces sp. DG2A-72]MDO0931128.1 hypothetical protein [Streptomyces sp. DG2A-72]
MRSPRLLRALGHRLPLQAGKGYSFSVELDPAPRHTLYFGERRAAASPIGGTTRIGGTMEPSGNNSRLDWHRVVAVALASRHYPGRWFDDPDDLVSGHGMLGVTLGPATGHRLAEYIRTGRRPEALAPFRFDRLRR